MITTKHIVPLLAAFAAIASNSVAFAQPARAVVVRKGPPPAPPKLPALRLEAGFGPASAGCNEAYDNPCDALAAGMALRAAALHLTRSGVTVGGALLHVRFRGTPEPSTLTALTVPVDITSGLEHPVVFRFGVELGFARGTSSNGACSGASGVALGASIGAWFRTTRTHGLGVRLGAIGAGPYSCQGNAAWRPPGPPPRTASINGSGHLLLESTFDF